MAAQPTAKSLLLRPRRVRAFSVSWLLQLTTQLDIAADEYIAETNKYLSTLSGSTARYETWFGSYLASRKDTVTSHFSKITGDPQVSTYDCTCTSSAYAYVVSSRRHSSLRIVEDFLPLYLTCLVPEQHGLYLPLQRLLDSTQHWY